jgi:phospholipase C
MIQPYPPQDASKGRSTVATTNEIYTEGGGFPSGPYGLGTRVPMIVASPWSLGGYVNSQVFDHTSLIRFVEARFADGSPDLIETNITPWRRAVAGDLTSAFNFEDPDEWKKAVLPSTRTYMTSNPPPTDRVPDAAVVPPATPTLPGQEPGVRPARALPYRVDVHGALRSTGFELDFLNAGAAAAVVHVRSGDPSQGPRSYTVGAGAALSDIWTLSPGSVYDLGAYGPNGFLRAFKGGAGPSRAALLVSIASGPEDDGLVILMVSNVGAGPANVNVFDRYRGRSDQAILASGQSFTKRSSRARFSGWYEFVVTVEHDGGFVCRLAGHLEDGRDSTSDPLMGGLIA